MSNSCSQSEALPNGGARRLVRVAAALALLAAIASGIVGSLSWAILFPDSPPGHLYRAAEAQLPRLALLAGKLQPWCQYLIWALTAVASGLLAAAALTRRGMPRLPTGAALLLIAVALVAGVVPSVAQRRWTTQQMSVARQEALRHPGDARAWLSYSRWLAREGNLEEALEAAHRASGIATEQVYEPDLLVGLLELALDDHAEPALSGDGPQKVQDRGLAVITAIGSVGTNIEVLQRIGGDGLVGDPVAFCESGGGLVRGG